jgi:hypothetical protein
VLGGVSVRVLTSLGRRRDKERIGNPGVSI